MARSKLPLEIRDTLKKQKWVPYAQTAGVEAYSKGSATIYIQPSAVDRNFFAWVILFSNNKPARSGSGVIESLSDTIKMF
jgi:hypothetical protein